MSFAFDGLRRLAETFKSKWNPAWSLRPGSKVILNSSGRVDSIKSSVLAQCADYLVELLTS